RRIDRGHLCVRMRTSQHRPVEQALGVVVVGVLRPPGGLHRPIPARNPRPDVLPLTCRRPLIVGHELLLKNLRPFVIGYLLSAICDLLWRTAVLTSKN